MIRGEEVRTSCREHGLSLVIPKRKKKEIKGSKFLRGGRSYHDSSDKGVMAMLARKKTKLYWGGGKHTAGGKGGLSYRLTIGWKKLERKREEKFSQEKTRSCTE